MQPVHREDDGDGFTWKSNRVKNHDHGNKPCLGNPCGSNTCSCCSNRDGNDLTYVWLNSRELCNEESRHCLIKSSSIHVDSGTDGEDKSRNPAVNFVLLLQSIDGDWKSGGAGGCSKRRHYCVPHVRNEPERQGTGDKSKEDGKNEAAVDGEPEKDGEEVITKFGKFTSNILHFEDLAGNEEANSNWRKVDDPGRHLHHDDADALKELEEGFPVLPALSDCNPCHHGKHDQSQDVRRVGLHLLELPCVLVANVNYYISLRVRHIVLPRIDELKLCLVHRRGNNVGWEHVPYEVHECVGRCNVSPLRQIRLLTQVLLASPRPDGDNEDDAKDDGKDGGHQIVDNGSHTNLARK